MKSWFSGRLKLALSFRGIEMGDNSKPYNELDKFFGLLRKRVKSDRKLNDLYIEIIKIIEPPSCKKTHCPNYSWTQGMCGCRLNLVPGKCKLNLDYLKRKKEKLENKTTEEK